MNEKKLRIQRIKLWRVNSWLIERGGRWIVVDTGRPDTVNDFLAAIENAECNPRDIALIVVTHAHYDHTGGACALQKISGAPVAIHALEADILRTGRFVISDGLTMLGRVRAFLARRLVLKRLFAFDPVEPDVIVENELRLDDYGFAASLIHTPGHSDGSISLLTDDGCFFAGDLTITQPLPGIWHHMPIYGSSVEAIKKTWRHAIERGARHIYPSHGRDFPATELEEFL